MDAGVMIPLGVFAMLVAGWYIQTRAAERLPLGDVIWGILAVAASQILGGSSTLAYVAAFGAGGAAAVLVPSLTTHWPVVRRPLRLA